MVYPPRRRQRHSGHRLPLGGADQQGDHVAHIGLGDWLFDFDNEEEISRLAPAVLALAPNPAAARKRGGGGQFLTLPDDVKARVVWRDTDAAAEPRALSVSQ